MTEHYKWLYGYIFNHIHNFEDTQDILQDTYLCAIVNREKLQDESRIKYWLRGIAANKIRQYWRKKTDSAELDDSLPGEDGLQPVFQQELVENLYSAVLSLPMDYQRIAVTSIMCGLPQAEVAEILSIPVTTVNNRVHKTKLLLKKELGNMMELGLEEFTGLLQSNLSQMERVEKWFETTREMILAKDAEGFVPRILQSPVFAADSAEAHLFIMEYCTFAKNWCEGSEFPQLFALAVQEFRLAEKLGMDHLFDGETGEEIPLWRHYDSAARMYTAYGDFDRAQAMDRQSENLGNPSRLTGAFILWKAGKIREAAERYLALLDDPKETDKWMITNHIHNCFKELGDRENQLKYQLAAYDSITDDYPVRGEPEVNANIRAGEGYYIALTYAALGDGESMLNWLKKSVDHNPQYAEWAKAQTGFAAWKEDPAFLSLCGEGGGTAQPIRERM